MSAKEIHFWDSSLILDFLQGKDSCLKFALQSAMVGSLSVLLSVLTRTEVLFLDREQLNNQPIFDIPTKTKIEDFFEHRFFVWQNITDNTARIAFELCYKHLTWARSGNDALHIATAIEFGVPIIFKTNDKKLW